MKNPQVLDVDGDRLRAELPTYDTDRVVVSPAVAGTPPRAQTVEWCLARLAADGCTTVHTTALTPDEQAPFLTCGFQVHERLHLLEHPLVDLPDPVRDPRLRRARRTDRKKLLAVDGRSFPAYWQIDRRGLHNATRATAVSRVRVATASGSVVGYAVSGRSVHRGYLQRLAVDPDHQGRGLGLGVVLDGLWWSRRRGARSVVVNTQEHNTRALALYERVGFRRQPDGLAVLARDLDAP